MKNRHMLQIKWANLLAGMARKAAIKSANTACPFWSYQDKLPDAVKKLRRF